MRTARATAQRHPPTRRQIRLASLTYERGFIPSDERPRRRRGDGEGRADCRRQKRRAQIARRESDRQLKRRRQRHGAQREPLGVHAAARQRLQHVDAGGAIAALRLGFHRGARPFPGRAATARWLPRSCGDADFQRGGWGRPTGAPSRGRARRGALGASLRSVPSHPILRRRLRANRRFAAKRRRPARGPMGNFQSGGAGLGQRRIRRSHALALGPGQTLGKRVATAVLPTMLGRTAAAGAVFAGKAFARGPRRSTTRRRQRHAQGDHRKPR